MFFCARIRSKIFLKTRKNPQFSASSLALKKKAIFNFRRNAEEKIVLECFSNLSSHKKTLPTHQTLWLHQQKKLLLKKPLQQRNQQQKKLLRRKSRPRKKLRQKNRTRKKLHQKKQPRKKLRRKNRSRKKLQQNKLRRKNAAKNRHVKLRRRKNNSLKIFKKRSREISGNAFFLFLKKVFDGESAQKREANFSEQRRTKIFEKRKFRVPAGTKKIVGTKKSRGRKIFFTKIFFRNLRAAFLKFSRRQRSRERCTKSPTRKNFRIQIFPKACPSRFAATSRQAP